MVTEKRLITFDLNDPQERKEVLALIEFAGAGAVAVVAGANIATLADIQGLMQSETGKTFWVPFIQMNDHLTDQEIATNLNLPVSSIRSYIRQIGRYAKHRNLPFSAFIQGDRNGKYFIPQSVTNLLKEKSNGLPQ